MTDQKTPTVGFISLGCPKATYDSERILTQLKMDGYDIVPSYEDADAVVVNTCGFIDSAKQESLDAIAEAMTENGKVIVTGCMGKGQDAEIIKEMNPNVLSVSGPAQYEEVVSAVHEFVPPKQHNPFIDLVPVPAEKEGVGVKLTPKHYAYLKISEGCNHRCSFCIIPHMRGDLVSRPIGDVLNEAERLAASGVKELLIVSQDTSAYGVDIKYRTGFWQGKPVKTKLEALAEALGDLGIWVRMHYVYPYPNVDEIVPKMAEGKILPYLDIPLQHSSPSLLKLMKRPAASDKTLDRIKKWREMCPDITIRSTFIVGHPGETEEDFEHLMNFLEEAQLDRVGCFQYSPVEGAPANDIPGIVPDDVKQARYDRFMQTQQVISTAKLAKKIGTRIAVIIDEVDEEGAIGRSTADAPEIDGMVYINDEFSLAPGDIVEVTVTHSDEYDLWGEL